MTVGAGLSGEACRHRRLLHAPAAGGTGARPSLIYKALVLVGVEAS